MSIDSPVARALLKKGVDAEVRVSGPKGELVYYVTGVRYTG
ncbi:MAG: GreA/GreB family elongation factor [Gammaproteobacteria bacterium]